MRVELNKKFTDETHLERGDYALVVMKDMNLFFIQSLDETEMNDEINTELLVLAKKENADIFKVQMLSKNSFSPIYKFNI